MGDFGPVDFVALKAEELCRMAQNAHGLIFYRFVKLYNVIEFMEKGLDLVMNWMGCASTNVIGSRLVPLFDDSSCPLNRKPKAWKEGLVYWLV